MMRYGLRLSIIASLVLPSALRAECTAVTRAQAWVDDAFVDNVTVEWRDGVITAVTPGGQPTAGCTVVDAGGKPVTPGLVDPVSQVGLVELGSEAGTQDHAHGSGPIRASFSVVDAYNPRSTLVPITRRAGITSAILVPTAGTIHGQSAWVDLGGRTQREAVVTPVVAVHAKVNSPSDGSRASVLNRIRLALREALVWNTNRAAWEQARYRPLDLSRHELEALLPVAQGRVPLVLEVDRASDIEAALRLAAEARLRLVILGGAEAWLMASELARAKVPVIVNPFVDGPRSFDQRHARADNAALLHAAGVPVLLSAFWTHNARTLTQVAGNAVRAGLSRAAALAAMTSGPATVFGLKSHGKLAVGRKANVVVWTGDPLELSTWASHVFIGGRAQTLETRQTRLRDRYLSDPARSIVDPPLP